MVYLIVAGPYHWEPGIGSKTQIKEGKSLPSTSRLLLGFGDCLVVKYNTDLKRVRAEVLCSCLACAAPCVSQWKGEGLELWFFKADTMGGLHSRPYNCSTPVTPVGKPALSSTHTLHWGTVIRWAIGYINWWKKEKLIMQGFSWIGSTEAERTFL